MIPKIIHYCWFGNGKKPQLVKDCIQSWKTLLPDFKIIEWNEQNTKFENSFVKKAYKFKKWAFVSDYVRLEKLFEYGGVYLDTDILLIRKFEDVLDTKMFVGSEDLMTINAAIVGSCKNHGFVKKMLSQYDSIKLSKYTNLYDITIPKIFTNTFRKTYDYNGSFEAIFLNKDLTVYPSDYFYPLPSSNQYKKKDYSEFLTENSYAVHLWGESWLEPNEFELLRKRNYAKGLKQGLYGFSHQKDKVKYIRKILSALKESLKSQ